MIRSFKDKLTASIDDGSIKKGFPADLVRRAQQLLYVLNAATSIEDLRSPPGNRLEKLSGDRAGQPISFLRHHFTHIDASFETHAANSGNTKT